MKKKHIAPEKDIDKMFDACLKCLKLRDCKPNSPEWKLVWDTLSFLRLFYERRESGEKV